MLEAKYRFIVAIERAYPADPATMVNVLLKEVKRTADADARDPIFVQDFNETLDAEIASLITMVKEMQNEIDSLKARLAELHAGSLSDKV